jgi:hypothetical protein
MPTDDRMEGKIMNIKIIVAVHKPYRVPTNEMYIPVQVGAEGKQNIGFVGDNTGDNISYKNSMYCELTGLYWGWKNIYSDYIGLVHYRRYFSFKKKGKDPYKSILSMSEISTLLVDVDIIVPKRRKYYIDTLDSHFNRMKLSLVTDLPMLRRIIEKFSPEYVDSYDRCIKRTWGHMFNMFIMKKELANEYCMWLFSILFELEGIINTSIEIHPGRKRIIGYLAEFLLDIWLDHNKYNCREINTVFTERNNEIKKIYKFIIRRLR